MDLYLSAQNRMYERTYPVRAGAAHRGTRARSRDTYTARLGTVYIVNGVAGSALGVEDGWATTSDALSTAPLRAFMSRTRHTGYARMHANRTRLLWELVDSTDGSTVDAFELLLAPPHDGRGRAGGAAPAAPLRSPPKDVRSRAGRARTLQPTKPLTATGRALRRQEPSAPPTAPPTMAAGPHASVGGGSGASTAAEASRSRHAAAGSVAARCATLNRMPLGTP